MKVRIKFSKTDHMKFLGHLDTMRYFQKAVRRAQLPASFTGGFSPHMIMSFAIPLGVGTISYGEYFDMELTDSVPTAEIEQRLNDVMTDGIRVLSVRQVEDGKAGKAMALAAAADYFVSFRPGKEPDVPWKEKIEEFYNQPSITVLKKTKKSEKEVDIRPYIYKMNLQEERIFLMLASASGNYTRPELVMDTFLSWLGETPKPFAYQIERLEIYADRGTEMCPDFVPLEELGDKVE